MYNKRRTLAVNKRTHTHTHIPNNRISREYKCTTDTMTRLNDYYNNNNNTRLGNTRFN